MTVPSDEVPKTDYLGTITVNVFRDQVTGARYAHTNVSLPTLGSEPDSYWMKEGESFALNDAQMPSELFVVVALPVRGSNGEQN